MMEAFNKALNLEPVAVLVNCNSGGARRNFGKVLSYLDLLRTYFADVAVYTFSGQGRAEKLTLDLLQKGGFGLIVVVGGDGTIAEVVNALMTQRACRNKVRMGIFPAGTANVFARELGISRA